jgi:ABC-type sugar transport system ATPase subunit
VFGLATASGRITVDGQLRQIASPADAIGAGIAYVPEDRRKHGVIGELRNSANLSLASLPQLARFGGWLDRKAERDAGQRLIRELDVRPPLLAAATRTLSGGNQQKVALGRWLMTAPSVLILDEPTQGVDVGAKAEIHRHVRRLAADGAAILLISSDLPELLSLSDRIIVMRGGAVTGSLSRAEATAESVMRLALGESAA